VSPQPSASDELFRKRLLIALAVLFAFASALLAVRVAAIQPLGIDFAAIWTGLRLGASSQTAGLRQGLDASRRTRR
jgi:hypothetical protein